MLYVYIINVFIYLGIHLVFGSVILDTEIYKPFGYLKVSTGSNFGYFNWLSFLPKPIYACITFWLKSPSKLN